MQIEKQSYSLIQLAAKQTMEYIKNIIKPEMNLLGIRRLCEEKLLEFIVKTKGDRVYIEKGNMTKLGDVKYFAFEPHIAFSDSKYGY